MHKVDVVHAIRCNMFARRDTIEEAMEYFHELIRAMHPDSGDRMAALTGLYVVTNTIAYQLEKNKEIDQCAQ